MTILANAPWQVRIYTDIGGSTGSYVRQVLDVDGTPAAANLAGRHVPAGLQDRANFHQRGSQPVARMINQRLLLLS